MQIQSRWATHAADGATGLDIYHYHAIEARRCTVQLSSGRLYLDAVASPTTALLGHDVPPLATTDEATVKGMLSALVPGYLCVALTESLGAAADFAVRAATSAMGGDHQITHINALEAEPTAGDDLVVAYENETLGRTGNWLATRSWSRAPALVVVGETLALGYPFGAVLARSNFASHFDAVARVDAGIPPADPEAIPLAGSGDQCAASPSEQTDGQKKFAWPEHTPAATPAALERVLAAVATVRREGLLEQGLNLANYLLARLSAMRASTPQIKNVERTGLCFRIAFASPLRAAEVRRRMCERGVLTGVDAEARLAIDPPLAMRVAEIDVITGALRASLLDLPPVGASLCCAACQNGD